MTLTHQPTAISMINDLMMKSHEACVDYMTPLGLHHIMGESIHFGPQPWLEKSRRADWTSALIARSPVATRLDYMPKRYSNAGEILTKSHSNIYYGFIM